MPRVVDLPDPVPGPGEVLLQVKAAGLNHADLHQMRGTYPPPPGESDVPGLECAGEVLTGAGDWRPGDRVMALTGGGAHGTLNAIPTGQLMAVPESFTWEQAAAVPEAGLTAWTNLVAEGGLQAGESVLITGATGGMGSFAAQLARELGARVLASGRDRERLEQLKALGIDEVFVDGDDLAKQVKAATDGRGVDLVFELVGGTSINAHLSALRNQGRLILIGLVGGRGVEMDLGQVLGRRLRIVGSVLRARPRPEKAKLVADFAAFALPRLRDGRLRPVVDRVLPFEQAPEGYKALESGGAFGKIVFKME